jgi:hypothetical protein
MRSRKSYLALVLAVAALLTAAFVGCGSDSTSSTPTTDGSADDPEFLVVQEQVNILADSVVTYLHHALAACRGLANSAIPVQYTVVPDGSGQIATDYADGWHVIDWSNLAASGVSIVADSIQFSINGNPRPSPIGAEAVNYVHNWYFAGTTDGMTDTTEGRGNFTLSGLYATTTTAVGSVEYTHSLNHVTDNYTVVREYDVTVAVTGVSLPQAASGPSFDAFDNFRSCPLSGEIQAIIVMSGQFGGGPTVTTTWEVDVTFEDGSASVTISSNNTVWTYDCTVCAA